MNPPVRRLTSAIVAATAVVSLASGTASATPAQADAGGRGVHGVAFALDGLSAHVISTFDPYVTRIPGKGFRLSVPGSLRASHPADVRVVERSLVLANAQLREMSADRAEKNSAAAAQKVHGGLDVLWWGWRLWLDEYATKRLVVALAGGAGASALAATLTSWTGVGGLSGLAVALLLGQTAVTTALCDTRSRGVVFEVPFVGAMRCTAR